MRLSDAANQLAGAGVENARGEAITIFSYLGGISRIEMIGRDPECDSDAVSAAIARRTAREPLQYIIGEVDFYRESYKVSPDCLIPRSDTETLVDFAVKNLPDGARFIDLCTGSGCIAISTLKNTNGTTAVALDLSRGALTIAKENAMRNDVADRISFFEADALSVRTDGEFYAVLSNPPYVTDAAYSKLADEIYFEPKMALVGTDEDGAGFYRRITELYLDVVERGGFIAFEIGYDQADALRECAERHGVKCEIIKDLCGNDRVAVLRK